MTVSVCSDQGSTYSGDLESEARSTPFSLADPEDTSHNLKPSVAISELDGPKDPPATSTASDMLDVEKDFPLGQEQILIISKCNDVPLILAACIDILD